MVWHAQHLGDAPGQIPHFDLHLSSRLEDGGDAIGRHVGQTDIQQIFHMDIGADHRLGRPQDHGPPSLDVPDQAGQDIAVQFIDEGARQIVKAGAGKPHPKISAKSGEAVLVVPLHKAIGIGLEAARQLSRSPRRGHHQPQRSQPIHMMGDAIRNLAIASDEYLQRTVGHFVLGQEGEMQNHRRLDIQILQLGQRPGQQYSARGQGNFARRGAEDGDPLAHILAQLPLQLGQGGPAQPATATDHHIMDHDAISLRRVSVRVGKSSKRRQ